MTVYATMVKAAAGLWVGTPPKDVTLSNEYHRGQVELIAEVGVLHPYLGLDHDLVKQYISRDIRAALVRT